MDTSFLGKSIKKNRELLHLTQDKLAELLNVSTHYIYELERGLKLPSLPVLIQIAEIFHVSIDSLLSAPVLSKNGDNFHALLENLTDSKKEKLYKIICQLLPYLNL